MVTCIRSCMKSDPKSSALFSGWRKYSTSIICLFPPQPYCPLSALLFHCISVLSIMDALHHTWAIHPVLKYSLSMNAHSSTLIYTYAFWCLYKSSQAPAHYLNQGWVEYWGRVLQCFQVAMYSALAPPTSLNLPALLGETETQWWHHCV